MKERLFKKNKSKTFQIQRKQQTSVCWNVVQLISSTMHVAFPCGVMKPEFTMMCKKMGPWVNFISCGIFLQACGGWAGSSQNCGCRSFVLPSQLRFPPSFLTQFCGGRSNVWIICNGGVSTNLNINGEIQIDETLDMKSCSIEFPNLLCDILWMLYAYMYMYKYTCTLQFEEIHVWL